MRMDSMRFGAKTWTEIRIRQLNKPSRLLNFRYFPAKNPQPVCQAGRLEDLLPAGRIPEKAASDEVHQGVVFLQIGRAHV